jgi:hypothetical protein
MRKKTKKEKKKKRKKIELNRTYRRNNFKFHILKLDTKVFHFFDSACVGADVVQQCSVGGCNIQTSVTRSTVVLCIEKTYFWEWRVRVKNPRDSQGTGPGTGTVVHYGTGTTSTVALLVQENIGLPQ